MEKMELKEAVDLYRETLRRYSQGFSLEEVLGTVVEAVGGERAVLFMRRSASSFLEPRLTWKLGQREKEAVRGRLLPVEWVYRQPARRFLVLESMAVSELGLEEITAPTDTLVLFPIRTHAYLRAALVISIPRDKPLPDPQSFKAAAVGVVLERMVEMFTIEDRLEEAVEKVGRPEVELGILSDYLIGKADCVQAASLSLDLLIKLLNMEGGTIHRVRSVGGQSMATLIASRGWGGMPDIIEQLFEDGLLDLLQSMRLSGEREFSLDAVRISEYFPVVKPYFHANQVKSFLLTPIYQDDRLVGLLTLFGRSYAAMEPQDMDLLVQVTHRLAALFSGEEAGEEAGKAVRSPSGFMSLVEEFSRMADRAANRKDFLSSALRDFSLELNSAMAFFYAGWEDDTRDFLWYAGSIYGGESLFKTTPALEKTAENLHRMAVVKPENAIMREMPAGEQAASEGLTLLLVPIREGNRFLLGGFYLHSHSRLTKAELNSLSPLLRLALGLARGVHERMLADGYRRALEKLAELEGELAACDDQERALRIMAKGSRDMLDCDRAVVLVVDQEEGTFRGALETRNGSRELDLSVLAYWEKMESDERGSPAAPVREAQEARERASQRIAVPLVGRRGTLGLLFVEREEGKSAFMDYQKRLLYFLAGQATATLESLQDRARSEVTTSEYRNLLDVSRRLSASASLEEMGGVMYQEMRESAGADLLVIALHGKTGMKRLGWMQGEKLEEKELGTFADPEGWLAISAQRAGQVTRNNLNTFFREPGEDELALKGIRSYLAVPVLGAGFKGMLLLGSTRAGAFGTREAELAKKASELLAGSLAVPLRLEGMQARIDLLEDMCRVQEEKLRMKTDLINLAAHEIRHPLTLIMGFSEVLRDYREWLNTRESREVVEKLNRAADRLRRSVVNMMEISRLESGKLAVDLEEVDLVQVLSGLREELRSRSTEHLVELDVDETAERMICDRDKLEIILFNLMDNAVKYSPPGSKVEVFARRSGEEVLIGVRDQGQGISQENINLIFQPFHKVGGEERGSIKGMGLGLYIVSRLVDALGGRIEVRSEHGKGSLFLVRLPQPGGETPLSTSHPDAMQA